MLGELGFDGAAFIKRGNDMTFIDALDPQWKGALPATFLFDGRGAKKKSWLGAVTYDQLRARVSSLLKRRKMMKLASMVSAIAIVSGAAAAVVRRARAAAAWRSGARCPPPSRRPR